jgi:hypothetical protein
MYCGWRFVYVLQPSHPEPSDPASQKIIGKVGPGERSPQKRPTDKDASEEFQKGRMPQLQKLQHASNHQHQCSDDPGSGVVQEQEEQNAPEYFVEYTVERIVDPVCGWACVELAIDSNRHDDQ